MFGYPVTLNYNQKGNTHQMSLGGVVSIVINIGIVYWMSQQFYGLVTDTSYSINTYNSVIDY